MNYITRLISLSILDSLIVTGAVILSYFLRFDFHVVPQYFWLVPYVVAAHIFLVFATFNWTKLYRRVWRYASVGELISLIKAVTAAEVVFYAVHQIVQFQLPQFVVPRSIYLLSWVLIILGIGGSRFAWRIFRDSYFKLQDHHRRTLIIGAGKAGVLIARELKHSPSAELYPVAFIDDDRTKWDLEILGLPVVGGRDRIQEAVKMLEIQKIVIAIPSSTKADISKILDICKTTNAKIKILPRVTDLVKGNVSVNMIREVRLEDLLGRDAVQVDLEGIANYVTGQVVLVTGAGGSIGSELCRQIAPFEPSRMLLLGHGENSIFDIENELRRSFPNYVIETVIADIQDLIRLREIFNSYCPSVIFHAAAHKHVPLMERNPAEAIKNNILGTKNVADCAHEYGALRFVMVSTDKAVNPTSIMGATKRVAEMYIQGLARTSGTKFVAVRFGNVLGSRGSVIPTFERQIREGGPVTVTHPDMVRYFMTIPEAAQLVIQAGALANGGEIFILDMGKPVKIADLARDLIRLSGYVPDEDINIVFTGIRPGEKLFEEILTNEEGISATRHNRIYVGKPGDFSWEELQFMVKKLEQVLVRKDTMDRPLEIKELLAQIVPSYMDSTKRAANEEMKYTLTELAAGLVRETNLISDEIKETLK